MIDIKLVSCVDNSEINNNNNFFEAQKNDV